MSPSDARRRRATPFALALLGALVVNGLPVDAAPVALDVSVSGENGVGVINTPGLPCARNGDGASWHYDYGAPLEPGTFSSLAGEARLRLDVHSEGAGAPLPSYSRGFLLERESKAVIANERGSIQLGLTAGDCAAPLLQFDGRTASGIGQWVIDAADGAYREATGSGSFTLLGAEVAPGADNEFDVSFGGSLSVLQPSLHVGVRRTYWALLGADYLARKVTVVYRITNKGPGDAFGVRLTGATSPTAGVTPRGPVPQALGDLLAGESADVRVRYELGLLKPCGLIILSCRFESTLAVSMPNALDVPAVRSRTVTAKAPDLPLPVL